MFFYMHITLKSIKANLTPQDNIRYHPIWAAPQKKGCPKKETHRKTAKKKRRTKKTTKTPEAERVDLEGKVVKDGKESKAGEGYGKGKILKCH
jgi:hypothetical protein